MSPQRQKRKTIAGVFDQIHGLTEHQPVLVIVEDVQWIDPSSHEVLDLVIERAQGLRILVVVIFRPEFVPTWTGQPHVTLLAMNRLSHKHSAAMVDRLTGGKALPPEVAEQIVVRTDGVPLFVEELTKTILDSGLLKEEADRYVLNGSLAPLAIPATLQDSLTARLDQLAPVKEVAQLAATLGRTFSHELLAAVSPLDEDALDDALTQLVQAGLIYRRGRLPDIVYKFKHALVRDAAYESLLRGKRQQLHGRIAEVMEAQFADMVDARPELLAHHYTGAGLNEKAVEYWHRAGERAIERSANLEALSHLTNALELLNNLPDTPGRKEQELSLLITLGPVEIAIKGSGSTEADDAYARAVALCAELPDSPRHFAAYWGQWRTSKNYRTKRERADKLLTVAENLGDPGLRLQAHHCQWASLFNLGFHRECCRHVECGMQLYDAGDFRSHASVYGGHDPAVCAHGEAALSLWLLGHPEQAVAHIEQALATARTLSHSGSKAHAIDIALMLHRYRQDATEVHAHAKQMIAFSEYEEFAVHRAKGEIFRGWALIRLGKVEQGFIGLHEGIDALRAIGTNEDLPVFLDMLAEGYGMIGRATQGLRELESAFEEADKAALRYWLAELLRRKGELLLAVRGEDEARAEACFTDSLQIARRQQAKSLELRTAVSYARLLQSRGEGAAAYELLSPVYDWFTEGFDSADLVDARTRLQELESRSGAS